MHNGCRILSTASIYAPTDTKWFRNTTQWILVGVIVAVQGVFIVLVVQSMAYSRSAFVKTLDIIVLSMIFGYTVAILVISYTKYPIRYGISNDGIHLKFLGRTEILYWETVRSIERVRGDPILGSTIIKKHNNAIHPIGFVSAKVFREINEEMEKHKGRLPR